MGLAKELFEINPEDIGDLEQAKLIIGKLFIIIESFHQDIQALKKTNQELKDEVNRIKGEQGKPNIRPNFKPNAQGDISSDCERKDAESVRGGKPRHQKKRKKPKPTRTQRCRLNKDALPPDIVSKGYERNTIAEVYFHVEYVEFKRDKYYSPSLKKTYIAPLPEGYTREFSPSVQAWVIAMKHELNSTESVISQFLNDRGLEISPATVSRMLTKDLDRFHQEKAAIFQAGLRCRTFAQSDDTKARVKGKNQHAHIFCNDQFTAFYTKPKKDRMTLLDILRMDKKREFVLNAEALELLRVWNLPEKRLLRLTPARGDRRYTEPELKALIQVLFADKALPPTYEKLIQEAAYIARYHQEDCLKALVCDHAPQFRFIALFLALCWVHEGRHYTKMQPIIAYHQKQLAAFRKQFWLFYGSLLDYQREPTPEKAIEVNSGFDSLCAFKATYPELKDRIAKTKANKTELLYVLTDPSVPLHNNESELGARKKVRDRDIRLHTMSEEGTRANDMFLTLRETARKQAVGFMAYILDRLSGSYAMTSLADLISQNHPAVSSA